MKIKEFWKTLTTPEEWHPAIIAVVGLAFAWALAVLTCAAFDAQF